MGLIALKLFGAWGFSAIGRWLWDRANRWRNEGRIPKDAVEMVEPQDWLRSDAGFNGAIVWEKSVACGLFVFAGLMLLSIVFQLTGALK